MSSLAPRVVLVSRPSEYTELLATHATRGQAAFFLKSRGQNLDQIQARDREQNHAINAAKNSIPMDWSFAHVLREDLSRFLFFPNDIVVAIGQDGLVANLAKYLDGQSVIGISPDPTISEGILTPYDVSVLDSALPAIANHDIGLTPLAMVQANIGNGMVLNALNELFIGHRSHQSARYTIQHGGKQEFQSSSGVIVATGTGLTGWAKSIMHATQHPVHIKPNESRAAFFAREPWPSRTSGSEINAGQIDQSNALKIVSRMNDGGVIFADGIEQDFLTFNWGTKAKVSMADKQLQMVQAV